ncbi:MAG TPA: rRNA methyltransferase, partial [Cyclobacteriaceae bacterium]
ENILMVHASKVQEIEFLTQQLHIITAGTTVAEVKHEKLIPDQAFALSLEIQNDFFNEIELTREQALQYLRKETIQSIESKKGFALFKFENLALGWANILDNRINNMYPANWRIRMTG